MGTRKECGYKVNRSAEIKIRVSEEDKKRWVAAAEHSGDSLSNWIRDALDAQCEFQQEDPLARLPVESAEKWVDKKTNSKGGCSFFTPRGTKCKACGKVHS